MKKIIVLISVLCIMVFLISCGEKNKLNKNVKTLVTDDYESPFGEEGSYIAFDGLPESLTLEDAVQGSNYILRQSQPYANQHVWDDFYERSNKGEASHVRLISFQEESMDHPYYKDIYYKDGFYTLYDSSDEDQIRHRFKYLLTLESSTGHPIVSMRQVVLTDKADLTYQAYMRAMTSSLSTDFEGIGPVHVLMVEVAKETTLINLSYEKQITRGNSDDGITNQILAIDTNFTPLENIYSSKVKTIQCDYEFEYGYTPIVKVHPDGYLVGSFISLDSSDISSKRVPVVMLMDETGEIIWKEIYDYSFTTGNMSNLVVYDDGRFLFTLSNWPESSMGSPQKVPSRLLQCHSNGKVNWVKEFDDTIGSVLKFVFLIEDRDILIAGEIQPLTSQSGVQNRVNSDISFIKLNDEGEEVARRQYGGLLNEYLKACKYIPGRGVVFTGWSNSSRGDFARKNTSSQWQDYVAFVNLDLDIEWVNHVETYERFLYDQLKVNGGDIYLIGNSRIDKEQKNRLENEQLFLVKYDLTGREVYKTYCLEHQSFQGVMGVDSNSEVVIGSGNTNKGVLSFYDKYGVKSHDALDISYMPIELTPTDTGGFVVKSVREIKSIPQPLYISSMWFDHDVLIEQYDEHKQLKWRKVFNDYDDIRIDFVEVFNH